MANRYDYVIVGGGLAGASAVQGIREIDTKGSILLIGNEKHLPYDRPPLSKKLWFGQKKIEEIFLHDPDYYKNHSVTLALSTRASSIDPKNRTVTAGTETYGYGRLLLATGGVPKRLKVPGGDLDGISYYRYLDDYLKVRASAAEGMRAVIIGGGFIGSELAAALNRNKVAVTMVYPSPYLVDRVFPEGLGRALQSHYVERGIRILSGVKPASFTKKGRRFVTKTDSGAEIESDSVIVGAGIIPSVELAEGAGLKTGNGVEVNGLLQTSEADIYAAGDIAFFPYAALQKSTRIEHWDNSLNQGALAGRNMAGANEEFTYMPYFFSDLFDFGYEAVGEVDSAMETFADWQKENDTGVIYYLKDKVVRGVMMCNVWDKVPAARELIKRKVRFDGKNLRGAL
ncbi:MAG: FAD-dependent oxidoreductase [Deltaproteobacteria bacterium]|nr:FAD-dependent oxidoreductase [Deltaproteobacteria bacterium]